MGKNIILCADGTGNKGGNTPDSNVYKIYNAIDIRSKETKQIKFYDNGIGTGDNKYISGISQAFGFGFGRNVCDLYRFLAKNYEDGDNVFLFGFSRGAATVRALSGFIATCGLISAQNEKKEVLSAERLNEKIKERFDAYRNAKKKPADAEAFREENKEKNQLGVIPIKCIGVWDTVAALGWPKDWEPLWFPPTLGVLVIDKFFRTLDWFLSRFRGAAHEFYEWELTENVEYAYQALAIDDERKSFRPMVWEEKDKEGNPKKTQVEQVWFAGAHSNVGGGYERAGLADVALDWMMAKIGQDELGLEFKSSAHEEIQGNATAHGQLYNSRDGFAIYFRYHPREIEQLSAGKMKDNIKIHHSVFERMHRRTANYAPGHLPNEFQVVDIDQESEVIADPEKRTRTSKSRRVGQRRMGKASQRDQEVGIPSQNAS